MVLAEEKNRIFSSRRRIRVSDCDTNGHLRIDAIGRYLQDIGYDDTDDIGVGDGGLWVARCVEMDFNNITKWPSRNEFIELSTFCSGVSHASAQRQVDLETSNGETIHTKTIWVSIDNHAKPCPIPLWLNDAYPNAKKISLKRQIPVIDLTQRFDGQELIWPLRASDIDINNHANNTVALVGLFEVSRVLELQNVINILVEYYSPISLQEETRLLYKKIDNGFEAFLANDKNIAVSMRWMT